MFVVCLNANTKTLFKLYKPFFSSEKRKYSNHTLKSMLVKHCNIENMTFLSRFERVRAQTPAISIETKER